MFRPIRPIVTAIAAIAVAHAFGADATNERISEQVSFNAHIRPIMSNTCFACHGPDEETNESGLRLDSFELATESAIVPGDADASPVYARLIDVKDPMPPADFRHQLSADDKAIFKRWIDQGSKYEQHWSYAPIVRPTPPATSSGNAIDGFIRRRLDAEGIEPSATADKATLLRRLSLDLIGIPPTPDEVDAFVGDAASDAYEKQVERLLASPHYGERMASQWLDLVRFSDTVGYHGDQNQRIFAYRDYVINAINENKPFDQFTMEQLAGDLLDDPTDEQLIASGLNRLNMMTREGGAQPGEYRAKYTADRVRMIGTAWLGSTTGCCECHNHKYDPFTAKDFYSLGAFFDDLRQWGVYSSYGYTPNKDLEGFNNEFPFPPELRFESPTLKQEIARLEDVLASTVGSEADSDAPLNAETLAWARDARDWLRSHPNGWMSVKPTAVSSEKETPIKTIDADVLPTGKTRRKDVIRLEYVATEAIAFRSVQLEILPDEANGGFVGRSADGRFAVSMAMAIQRDDVIDGDGKIETREIPIALGQVDRQKPTQYRSGLDPRYLEETWRSGPAVWQLPVTETQLPHTAVYHLSELVSLHPHERLIVRLKTDDIGKFRVSVSPFSRFVVGQPTAPDSLAGAIDDLERDQKMDASSKAIVAAARYASVVPVKDQSSDFKRIRDRILDCHSGYALTMISQPVPADAIPVARVLPRGNWQDESGEIVMPAFPEFLGRTVSEPKAGSDDRRLNRLDLARWLTSDENPLVARHYVNRTWKHFFGAGLSNKLDDLGSQGEWPSHPELLDYLASEFREGWNMKNITRMIVNSNTYRQAAAVRSDLKEIDPYNRLLAQQSARRLEAESVRDNALAIAGLLQTDIIGGRSVFPYQPEDYYSNLQFPDRSYDADDTFAQYRRGLYMHWQRTFLHPMLVNFDAPSRDECVADRTVSNSPQQALTLLNDPSFVEAARVFSNRLINANPNGSFDERIDLAFHFALSRSPRSEEAAGLKTLYESQLEYFRDHPDDSSGFTVDEDPDAAERAALGQVCRVILNLHETITRY
ncbi:Planctomycete cytochrome C [Rubripirellula tenax]|uniref:Planctomycete cytochrome C n=1 Tax=Rubripirellula tenax TaxID=2528015 RepID=A0A5C6FKH5_9BACT|nr:PSD1 and planctomycete cytochrome C domain-containing protein [Rubripirellula tenax]TWU60569.1 Planctomycete cytochrome C [Rubripirellula tenax]